MSKDIQRQNLQLEREKLIAKLEDFYRNAFEKLSNVDIGEKQVAKLTQILLQSRDGAITPLQKNIEKPIITKAPNKQ